AGNAAPFTDSATLDTVAPDAPTIDPTDGGTISGTAETGSTVTLTDEDGNTLGEPVLVDGDGIWTVTPDTPLAGGNEITATATDPAGNASPDETVTVDVDALLPPTIMLPETDDGFLNADELADGVQILADLPADAALGDVINVTLAGGTGGIGGTYTLTQRDLNVGQALFEIEGDLPDGDYTATSTLTRGDGSESATSGGYDFTVDTTPPGLPILLLNPVSAVLSIDAEPDSIVRLAVGLAGQEVSLTVPTDENGDASVNLLADIGLDLDLSDIAQLGIAVAAEDQAGNTSDFARIGLNPPDANPPLPATDMAISDDGTTLSGVAEANATVLMDLDMDGTGELTTTADEDGSFSFTIDPPLIDGELVDVIVVDAIGNASDPVAALAPRDEPADGFAPRMFVQSVEEGYINADAADGGIDTRVRLPSDAAEGDTLTLQLTGDDGNTVAQDYVLTAGDLANRFLELTLDAVDGTFPQGATTITSTLDRGDSQTVSNSVAFDLDTIAPSTPVVDFLGTALSISGEPGSTVEIGISLAGVTTSVTLDVTNDEPVLLDLLSDISLDINPADLLNASVSVVGRDAAGNQSGVAELNLGTSLLDGSDLVTIGGFGVTEVSLGELGIPPTGPRLVVGGNTTPNATLALTVGLLGASAIVDVQADENGDFGINLLSSETIADLGLSLTGLIGELLSDPDLLAGISISAVATDPDGNSSTEYGLSIAGSGIDLSIGEVSIVGGDGDDLLGGTDDAENIAAGDGDDIILDVGSGDTVEAGAGDDIIELGTTDFVSIDGGEGFDTLRLSEALDLDLTVSGVGSVSNIDRIDLGSGNGANNLTLDADSALALVGENGTLQISGGQEDSLEATGATFVGSVVAGGPAYDQYALGDVTLNVASGTLEVTGTVTAAPGDLEVIEDGSVLLGMAPAGSVVSVIDAEGATLGEVAVALDGTFEFPLETPVAPGESLSVVATSPAGVASEPATFTVADVTAPSVPDASLGDNGVTVTGTAEAGSRIEVTGPTGAVLATATADDAGAFEITLDAALTNGETTSVTATDSAGNESSALTLTAPDTTAPTQPEGVTFTDDGITLEGSTEANASISVTGPNGATLGSGVANADGDFSVAIEPALNDGETAEIVVTDAAGNSSEPLEIVAPDTTAPTLTNITFAEDGSALDGMTAAGSTVVVINDAGVQLGTVEVEASGSFSLTFAPALANGEAVTVTATDASDNVSEAITVTAPDITAPSVPTINPSDGETLGGTAEAGSTVTLTNGADEPIGSVTAETDGTWSFSPATALAVGTTVVATATDAAGNVSVEATTDIADIDFSTPPIVTLPGEDAGFINSDELANGVQALADLPAGAAAGDILSVTIEGDGGTLTGELTLSERDIAAGRAIADVEGDLPDGDYSVSGAILRDDGVDSAPSEGVAFTLDTEAPSIPDASINALTGVLNIGGEPDSLATVTAALGGQSVSLQVPTDAQGNASVDLLTELGLDLNLGNLLQAAIGVTTQDQAGNVSEPFALGIGLPDATPPLPASEVTVSDDGTSVSGSAEAGAIVSLDFNADEIADATTTADETGAFSVAIDPPLIDGELVSVTVADAAGRVSDETVTLAPRIDTGEAIAPRIAVQALNDGYINADAAENGIATRVSLPSDAQVGDNFRVRLASETGTTTTTTAVTLTAATLAAGFLDLAIANDGELPQGLAVISAILDRGGEETTSNGVELLIDTFAPGTPTLNAIGGALGIEADANSSVTVEANVAGVSKAITLQTGDDGLADVNLLEDISLGFSPADLLDAGFRVYGEDEAGNRSGIVDANLGASLLDGSDLLTIGGFGITDFSLGTVFPPTGPILEIGGVTDPGATLTFTAFLGGNSVTLTTQADDTGAWGINLLSTEVVEALDITLSLDVLSGLGVNVVAELDGQTSSEYGISLGIDGLSLDIGTVNLTGTENGDRLVGTDAAETFTTGAGDDVILNVGGGTDSLLGAADTVDSGAGDDLIELAADNFDSIDGGEGFDTLLIGGEGIDLDYTDGFLNPQTPDNISNIERIDLGSGDSGNSLTLEEEDAELLAGDDNELQITGDENDTLNITGAVQGEATVSGGVAYDQYTFGDATIQVEQETVQIET
ncbi:Ig-like domain-containing protein, partial [Chromohalobacter sarecensis]